ncbi:MAG: LapA family protein [Deltaproteobacteria bacterium]|nr:LapA family protein [Deltaproteobacteria bacterium]
MRYVKVIFGFILVLFGIVFLLENRVVLEHAVTLRFDVYFFQFESAAIPLWVMILFTFFLGAFTAFLYFIYEHFKQRQVIRQLRHNIEIMGSELKKAEVAVEASAASLKAAAFTAEAAAHPEEAHPEEKEPE